MSEGFLSFIIPIKCHQVPPEPLIAFLTAGTSLVKTVSNHGACSSWPGASGEPLSTHQIHKEGKWSSKALRGHLPIPWGHLPVPWRWGGYLPATKQQLKVTAGVRSGSGSRIFHLLDVAQFLKCGLVPQLWSVAQLAYCPIGLHHLIFTRGHPRLGIVTRSLGRAGSPLAARLQLPEGRQ